MNLNKKMIEMSRCFGDYFNNITNEECRIMRGWAIIAIVLHNYCHKLPLAPAENEFTWGFDHTLYFLHHFADSPFINIFSFLGHYGVPIFVFLSGYGLAMKYERSNGGKINIKRFILSHYKKLTSMMLLGLLAFYLYNWVVLDSFAMDGNSWLKLVATLTYTINLIPFGYPPVQPGPYWYFMLTMELYLVYILFLYKRGNLLPFLLCAISIMAFVVFEGQGKMILWLKLNLFGASIPFALGILAGRYNRMEKKSITDSHSSVYGVFVLISLLILVLSEMNFYTWIFTSIAVLVFGISLSKLSIGVLGKVVGWIGGISNLIFVIHPIVRELFFGEKVILPATSAVGLLSYIAITLAIAAIIKYRNQILHSVQKAFHVF
jgi:uncharacterized membrane protein YidH (DUF202 family)